MLIASRLQIRLRTLLAFVGLVCLVASFVATARREMKSEDAAVEIVRAHGGDVVYEGDEGDWTRFASAATRVWPLRLFAIEYSRRRHVSDLPSLREISVDSPSLRLSNLPKLHHLIVRHCSELRLMGALEVEFVSFAMCEMPAEQLTWMAKCGKLRHLALEQYERPTPEVLRAVAKCSSLERLSLDACDVLRADHLAELGSLTKLADLSLKDTRVSVQDVQRLLARLRLKRLTISEYLVDRADGEQLRAVHPQVAIFLAQ